MTRSKAIVTVFVLALLIGSVPTDSYACYRCLYSPNNWGFCRPGFDRGHGDCKDSVVDGFNGRTDCEILIQWNCYNGGTIYRTGCENCEPLHYADNSPCSWTDTELLQVV